MILSASKGHIFTGTQEQAEKALSLDAYQRILLLEASRLYDGCIQLGYPLSAVQFEDGSVIEFVKTL
jgi:hypothetical protein